MMNIDKPGKCVFSWLGRDVVCFVILSCSMAAVAIGIGHFLSVSPSDSGVFKPVNDIGKLIEDLETVFATAILAIAAILTAREQLEKNRESQRRTFLVQYVSNIFTDKELADSFHYLVYTFQDYVFCEVKSKLKDEGITRESGHKEMYRCLEAMQHGRKEGHRLYHPAMFQGSLEERRLDSLLSFFNIIAFYSSNTDQERGLLSKEEIEGFIGYNLAAIRRRGVVREYLRHIEDMWIEGGYRDAFGREPPFPYLRKLLEELDHEQLDNVDLAEKRKEWHNPPSPGQRGGEK